MAVTSELAVLHRSVDELRVSIEDVRSRYGEIRPVQRLVGDLERLDLDVRDLAEVTPPPSPSGAGDIQLIDDRPPDPSLWAEADDEGLGGYQRGVNR